MQDSVSAAFAFVQGLAAELNKGELRLPSFPDAVLRIRKALADENCTTDRLARIAASDQVLAGRLLRLANSALLQRGADRVTDLRTAIQRLGFAMVRNAAISVAMEQILRARDLGASVNDVKALWRRSTRVAALSYVVAKRLANSSRRGFSRRTAAQRRQALHTDARARDQPICSRERSASALDSWHGSIGRLIIEHWGFSEAQAAAAEDYLDLERKPYHPDLTDVVQVATLLDAMATQPDAQTVHLDELKSGRRLGLRHQQANEIIRESNEEIRALADALTS